MQRVRYLTGFLPWLVFGAFGAGHAREAALASCATAVLVTVWSERRGAPKTVEVSSLLGFGVLALIAVAAGASGTHFLAHYARAVPASALAAGTFVSLRSTPLIEQYARRAVAPEVAGTVRFRRRMRQFTILWGTIFVAMASSHVIAGVLDTPHANKIFNWGVPIGLVMLGVRYMRSRGSATSPASKGGESWPEMPSIERCSPTKT